MTINVLFVCLGNICRSPMADGVFAEMVRAAGLAQKIRVDSAGTGSWHVGEEAHSGTRRVLRAHGIAYDGRARQMADSDLDDEQTYIVAMDESNLNTIRRLWGDHGRLYRLLDFARHTAEKNVPDPYYTGNFEYVFELVNDGCAGLLAHIRQEEGV